MRQMLVKANARKTTGRWIDHWSLFTAIFSSSFFFFIYLLNSAAAAAVVSYLLTVTGGLPSQRNTLELSCTIHKFSNTRPTETTARSKNHFALFVFAGNDSIFPTQCYLGVFLLHNGFLSQIRFSKINNEISMVCQHKHFSLIILRLFFYFVYFFSSVDFTNLLTELKISSNVTGVQRHPSISLGVR